MKGRSALTTLSATVPERHESREILKACVGHLRCVQVDGAAELRALVAAVIGPLGGLNFL